ncbi:MAG: hypothetical protein DPW14_04550 [Planctomycetes bacterium]|nr:hypothetical protein [Planctomycetota bacterium]
MNDDAEATDLFGQAIVRPRPDFEEALEQRDRETLRARAERTRWVVELLPENTTFLLPPETAFVLDSARDAFIQGNYVAAVVTAAAFVEHWFRANWDARKAEWGEMPRSIGAAIKQARAMRLVDESLLDRVDALRLIRNPIVHLQEADHPDTIVRRSIAKGVDFPATLEKDARQAMVTMHGFAVHAF